MGPFAAAPCPRLPHRRPLTRPGEAPLSIRLENGSLALALDPSLGGAITGFWHDGFAILRETPTNAQSARQTSSYPLIPFSNRVAHGRFTFDNVEHRLALNFGDHPHAIHGNAWQRPWTMASADGTHAHLIVHHEPVGEGAKEWPFAYAAEQHVRLTDVGLSVGLVVENQDRRPMPVGLGLHPFFPRRPGVRLQFEAAEVYLSGPDQLPVASEPVPARWDYRHLRDLGEPRLDHCFRGWTRTARIAYPDDRVAVVIDADPVVGHLVVYVPEGRDFFAVEPVSHVNNALNRPDWADHGLRILQPGERLAASVRFRVERVR